MALFSLLIVALSHAVAECPAGGILPGEDWVDQSEAIATSHRQEIDALREYLFTLEGEDEDRKGIRSDGVIVVQHGEILFEEYGRGFNATNPHLMWSVSKSINNILVGRGIYEGLINSVHDSICDYYEAVPTENCDISILDLMRFTSGLDCKDVYENESNQVSSVLAMLYGVGRTDMAAFVASHGKKHPPGTIVDYSTGDATLLSAVLGGAYMEEDFPWSIFFEPLGMKSAVFERDIAGTYVGGSYAYFTPRDSARVGQFFLQDGCWNGERLLPEGWIQSSTTIPENDYDLYRDQNGGNSGWSWWRHENVHTKELDHPNIPASAYLASGHWGQSIWVIPSWDMVLVRTGDDRDGSLDHNSWVPLAMKLAQPPTEESP